jgi:hypothetical protein
MIINPVMARSTLNTRGVQAAMVSFMNVPSVCVTRLIGIAPRLLRKARRHKEIGDVSQSSSGIMPAPECLRRAPCRDDVTSDLLSTVRAKEKGPGKPRPFE